MKTNLILMSDSYKYSHNVQYPEGTEYINSYIEARGSADPSIKKTLFFGLQAFIREYLLEPITMTDVIRAQEVIEAHGEPFNYSDWEYIVKEHGGYLPIEIEAVEEGSIVELSNVMVQIRNTDPRLFWLTSFIETALLRAIWYPTTVATNSWLVKQDLLAYAEKSGSVEGVDFKLHDFGARGVSSHESAMLGGMSHLINFMGTDTVESLLAARIYYNEDMAGFSIPATEHSTMTLWGQDKEVDAYRNMLKQYGGEGKLLAVVSDSYDIYNAARNIWGGALKQEVIDSGATVVVRPDSGNPVTVPIDIIKILMEQYGYDITETGYKVLPKCIRVIQGDGITPESIKEIIANLDKNKLALDNIAFGMGGGLLQMVNRDTFQFAMKASYAIVNGEPRNVFKKPVTDSGKSSKQGELGLYKVQGEFVTYDKNVVWDGIGDNYLKPIFRNGQLLRHQNFSEVRELSNR